MTVRILLADDHKIVREGLRNLLQKTDSFEVVGEADDGREAIRLVGEVKPDLVIMDVTMPNLNGVEATRQIRGSFPDTQVLALSMHADKPFVRRMLQAGAGGYLLKECAFEELSDAVNTVTSGKTYLSNGVAEVVVEGFVKGEKGERKSPLTPREIETLQLLAEGKSTREVAKLMKISVKTVETHRKQIMTKLSLKSIAELTKYAIREGWTSL